MRRVAYSIFLIVLILIIGYSCFDKGKKKKEFTFLNHDPSVTYVGKEVCKGCHPDIYTSFVETGMGMSWGMASHEKSSGRFGKGALVYDTLRGLYYHPFWRGDTLQLVEFRLNGKDTIFKRTENIKYIVGSGQHTNSHIYEVNGFLYQAPVTYYTQKGIWNLPPGFEGGNNTRFSRAIEPECMSCHNALPVVDEQSTNRYEKVELGLSCERCHGPGSLHVAEKLKGNIVDIKKEADPTIVNPAKLPWQLQVDVCQRCHLQGNAVLQQGKSFADFRPGMKLSSVMDVYMPHYEGNDSKMIMASHAERLQKSKCFIAGNQNASGEGKGLNLTCITCHNPHVSVKKTDKEVFNKVCNNCHNTGSCKATELELKKENNNCVKCHMPVNGATDIPHVSVHDHYIKKPLNKADLNEIRKFAGIRCVNNPSPTPASKAEGYLNYLEKFDSKQFSSLDSARFYLEMCPERVDLWVHYLYLKEDYASIIEKAITSNLAKEGGAWTCYRVAEAYMKQQDYENANRWIGRAVSLKPKDLQFLLKQGNVRYNLGKEHEAQLIFEAILAYNPKYAEAWSSLGLVICKRGEGDLKKAMEYYTEALSLDPDLETALINALDIFNATGDRENFIAYLKRLHRINPTNEKLIPMYRQFSIR
jgi:Tfp pilus assembly protein PilF